MVKIPIPSNLWLRRRRFSGATFEVERLYSRYQTILKTGSLPDANSFIVREYRRHEVYYSFIRMISIRRLLCNLQRRYLQENPSDIVISSQIQ